jgi:hypothetical protein
MHSPRNARVTNAGVISILLVVSCCYFLGANDWFGNADPVGRMVETTAMAPIKEVEAAVKAKDRARFIAAFDKLTAACNTCHQSSNRPFIVVQRPTGSAFPNQSFAPKK